MKTTLGGLIAVAGTALLLGNVWWGKAMRRLSPTGASNVGRIIFVSKLSTGPENFTPEGWSYWVKARRAGAVFLACGLAAVFAAAALMRTT